MHRLFFVVCAINFSANAQVITETFGSGGNQFEIKFVRIGNTENAGDTRYMGQHNGRAMGEVPYVYNLGKYEISRDMINKANNLGNLGITLYDMSGNGGNGANRPAPGVSWNEAARFVNWLNTSKGYQAAYNFLSNGANDNISLWGEGQYSGTNKYRHKDAFYFLPSADEWYKGAYGSPSGNWYDYATGSNGAPTPVSSGSDAGTAVYNLQSSPADIYEAGGLSPYGTMAQGGNEWEWNETAYDGINDSPTEKRDRRGGSAGNDWYVLHAATREILFDFNNPTDEGGGIRIAMVPEPSALSLLAFGLGGLAILRRRR